MNEVEKMYKLANIQPQYKKRIECKEGYTIGQPCGKSPCIDCNKSVFEDVMPPFTAEKLINLEMFLINKGDFGIKKGSKDITFESFTSCVAGLINNLWQDLTEEERKQIKEILE